MSRLQSASYQCKYTVPRLGLRLKNTIILDALTVKLWKIFGLVVEVWMLEVAQKLKYVCLMNVM